MYGCSPGTSVWATRSTISCNIECSFQPAGEALARAFEFRAKPLDDNAHGVHCLDCADTLPRGPDVTPLGHLADVAAVVAARRRARQVIGVHASGSQRRLEPARRRAREA